MVRADNVAYIFLMIRTAPIFRPDRSEARQFLACLGERYPDGLNWLELRLDDVEAGRAQAWRASLGSLAVGYAIATPKGERRVKLSTLYVAPFARGVGVGRELLKSLANDWCAREVEQAFVTVDENDQATANFFAAHGYALLTGARRAYGLRSDAVYSLSPESLLTARPCPAMACSN